MSGGPRQGPLLMSGCSPLAVVSRFGLAVRRFRPVSRKTSVRIRFGSPFSSEVVVCGHCLVTLSITVNETLNWLSSLPILMQCSDRSAISLFSHLLLVLISLMVSVDDKHRVYLSCCCLEQLMFTLLMF